ncbi:MAG: DNA polymerase III subunit delta' [Paludibacter sp.]|nr:DNA polymerase III subunit delta' [Bacteroidales bacterium]MCM1068591.1 DNA polymerase III subunit delta' [Prevotella sp.]MCM1353255.1 DNA polymerase III subunit delta' [Bacteroides sp.]MCM1442337.1 DNA polymerase III subunit delta' [Muribaculum sp.]MCM1481156.1 DNA polymerase III subunit delta' [Paludibacter sp.]
MRFAEIIGQDDVKHRLVHSVAEGRIPHAQMLWGPSGVGKLQLAVAYAQYLACPHRTETDSCGVCPSCLQFAKLQHPDLHFVFPIYKEKAGRDSVCDDFIDKFRTILIEKRYFDVNDWYGFIGAKTKQGVIYEAESGEIMRKLSLKSYMGGYKTMIIWLPEKMHVACANKLLKILEEPPERTVFLLVSEEPEVLLSTIVSRTQQVQVPRLDETVIAQALQEQYEDMDKQSISNFAHLANGSILKALHSIDENEDNKTVFQFFVQLMRLAWSVGHQKDYSALQKLQEWSENVASAAGGREWQKNFLQYMQRQVRENYICNLQVTSLNYQTVEESRFSEKFAPFINERNVEQMMMQLDLAQRQIEQNGNAKIIFFDLCLQMIVLLK